MHRFFGAFVACALVLAIISFTGYSYSFAAMQGQASQDQAASGVILTQVDQEKILFSVEFWGINLIDTTIEAKLVQLADKAAPVLMLINQPVRNMFWNDRMISFVDQKTLMPERLNTHIKTAQTERIESLLFDRKNKVATFRVQEVKTNHTNTYEIPIAEYTMDPLSAFFTVRNKIAEHGAQVVLSGITGERGFFFHARETGLEQITVPLGTYNAHRVECTMTTWLLPEAPIDPVYSKEKKTDHTFVVWLSDTRERIPLQIRYNLLLGNMWVKATQVSTPAKGAMFSPLN